eukprot:178105-Amphidinium_carterae.1
MLLHTAHSVAQAQSLSYQYNVRVSALVLRAERAAYSHSKMRHRRTIQEGHDNNDGEDDKHEYE